MLLEERFQQLRLQMTALRRTLQEFEAQAQLAKEHFGLQAAAKKPPVVDVGPSKGVLRSVGSLAKRSLQACLLVASFALLGFALLSLGMFAGTAVLAFLVITRGLGLRIDVNGPAAAV